LAISESETQQDAIQDQAQAGRPLGRLKRYAKASGKTVSAVTNQAIKYWYENHGEIVLEELVKMGRPHLIKRRKA
jgi:hypothetical protein